MKQPCRIEGFVGERDILNIENFEGNGECWVAMNVARLNRFPRICFHHSKRERDNAQKKTTLHH